MEDVKLPFDVKGWATPALTVEVKSTTLPITYHERIPQDNYVRLCPNLAWRLDITYIRVKNVNDENNGLDKEGSIYVIHQDILPQVTQEYGQEVLRRANVRLGVVAKPRHYFFWILKSDETKANTWNASAMKCATELEKVWGLVKSNTIIGRYNVYPRDESRSKYKWSEPTWPDVEYFGKYFTEAFKPIMVTSMDHDCFKNKSGDYDIEEFLE